jgi:glycosyltransferase involved in cell wall biosynthesis
LPNFIPDDVAMRANPDHPSLTTLPATPYFLFVGALTRAKGIDVLLDAYGSLQGVPPLVLIGTRWPDTPETLPRNVTILENLPHEAVMAAWRRSIAAIVPSVFPDPCPTVVMEAMASGLPVIGSRIGGIPDLVINEQTGLLVEPGNPRDLAACLRRIVADPASAQGMGEAGLQHVQQFTATSVVDRLERIYLELIATPRTSRRASRDIRRDG